MYKCIFLLSLGLSTQLVKLLTYPFFFREGAKLQTMEPQKRVMCRSLHEVEYLANNGFDDILFGFPLIKQNIPMIKK